MAEANHICTLDACDAPTLAKGMCVKHYHQARRRPVSPAICARCGLSFKPRAGKAKYCGNACKSGSLIEQRAERRARLVADIYPVWKKCGRCGENKKRDTFRKDAKRIDGLYPWCNECWRAYTGVKARQKSELSKREYDQARRARLKIEVGAPQLSAAHRQSHLLRMFNLTLEEYDAMLTAQDGRCAICRRSAVEVGANQSGKARALAVDHDHRCCPGNSSCGRCVRALLCAHCNTGIGMFREDTRLMSAAIDYLGNTAGVTYASPSPERERSPEASARQAS